MKRAYAKINLRDPGLLQSKYALRLFEMAKSYESLAGKDGNPSGAWHFERSVQELRMMFGVSEDAYPVIKRFRQFVIENPVKEINAAGIGLEITTESIKQGRRLAAIRLNGKKTPRKTSEKRGRRKKGEDPQALALAKPNPRIAGGKARKELERLKELHPAEFSEFYKEAFAKTPSWAPGAFRQLSAEVAALTALKETYGVVK